MYTIGITGGIACGKSTVTGIVARLGAAVIDADQVAKAMTTPGGIAAPMILERFGTLDRKALASIIFNDEKSRESLNAIVHPLVRREMASILAETRADIVALEIPLLYESGMEDLADEVWVVYADEETQIRRLLLRNGLSREEALSRVKSQMPIDEKAKRADHVIDNSGDAASTRRQTIALFENARRKAGLVNE